MAKQSMPERDRVGASLLAAIPCNPKQFVSAQEDYRRRLEKCILAKVRFERAAVILLDRTSPRLLVLPALSPFNQNRDEKVAEKILSLAGEKV